MNKVASVFIIVLLTILVPVGAFVYRINTFVLQPEPLLETLEEQGVYSQFIQDAIEQYITSGTLEEMEIYFFTEQEIEQLALSIFPEQWIQTNVSTVVTELYTLLQPNTTFSEINPVISLQEPKQLFTDEVHKKMESLEAEIQSLPACTDEQLTALATTIETTPFSSLINTGCLPAEVDPSDAFIIGGNLPFDPAFIISEIPNQLQVLRFIMPISGTSQELYMHDQPLSEMEYYHLQEYQQGVDSAQTVAYRLKQIVPVMAILILMLYGILVLLLMKNVPSLIRWCTAAVGVPGLLLLCTGAAYYFLVSIIFTASPVFSMMPPLINSWLMTVADAYIKDFAAFFFVVGAFFVVAAIVGIAVSITLHQRSKDHESAA